MASCTLIKLILLLSFSIYMWTCSHAAREKHTLKPGDTLDSTSLLVSANGKFNLGFQVFKKDSNSSCLALWLYDESSISVWVANRSTPILYPTGVLTLDKNSTLKITQKSGDPPVVIYSGSSSTTNNSNVVATLLDSGNFVLQELNSYGSIKQVLWQSFDYPTNTLLPGMKLGVNHRNGHTWLLTSNLIPERPAPGSFTLDWDTKELQLKISRNGTVYWSSGIFRNGRFTFIDNLQGDHESKLPAYNFSIVSNGSEEYFTYTIANQSLASFWQLDTDGQVHDWNLDAVIAEANLCDGYTTDGGCQSWDQPSCRNPNDRFEPKTGFFYPDDLTYTIKYPSNTTEVDCKAACWKMCDCVGFKFRYRNRTGCKLMLGNIMFREDIFGKVSEILVKSSRNNNRKKIEIGSATASAAIGLVLMALCIVWCRQRRNVALHGAGNETEDGNELLNLLQSDRPTDAKMGRNDLTMFSYASVMAATENLSIENKLGQGGFGPVYKGKMVTGQEIAVKRLSKCSGQGTLEFKNELILISELQHTNLVQLFGFCIHGEERMLIYDYMPNKSLDYLLFDSTRAMLLDWKKRFSIIEGIAQGLLYLHKYSRVRVIHRDLKASNILLDADMNPKISDFGLARIFTHNELQANTNRVVGTYGYMSPEYAMEGIFSTKSDVYSFGVLMLEIISGRRNNSFYTADRVLNIVGHAWELWKEGAGLRLMDPAIIDSCINGDQLLRCIHIGLLCVEENEADRPTMSDVISMLTNESLVLPIPTKPAFFTSRKEVQGCKNGKESKIISANGLSISTIDAR